MADEFQFYSCPLGKNDSNWFKITAPRVPFVLESKHFGGKRWVFTEERILPLGSYWFSHYFNLKLAKLSRFWNPSHQMLNLSFSLASQGKCGGIHSSQRSLNTSHTLQVKGHQPNQHINHLARNSCLTKFYLFIRFFSVQTSFIFAKPFLSLKMS